MTGSEQERGEIVSRAMALIEARGAEVSLAMLAAESGMSRSRIERHFADEAALFDAIVEDWYAPDVAIMEEVVASDLPIRRKFYEFFARRFVRELARYEEDPATFRLYCELGEARFEQVRGYIELADHYLAELIAQAQDEGFFPDLTIERALSLINQSVICYTSPQVLMMLEARLDESKLAQIVDTLFAGLAGGDRGARSVGALHAA